MLRAILVVLLLGVPTLVSADTRFRFQKPPAAAREGDMGAYQPTNRAAQPRPLDTKLRALSQQAEVYIYPGDDLVSTLAKATLGSTIVLVGPGVFNLSGDPGNIIGIHFRGINSPGLVNIGSTWFQLTLSSGTIRDVSLSDFGLFLYGSQAFHVVFNRTGSGPLPSTAFVTLDTSAGYPSSIHDGLLRAFAPVAVGIDCTLPTCTYATVVGNRFHEATTALQYSLASGTVQAANAGTIVVLPGPTTKRI